MRVLTIPFLAVLAMYDVVSLREKDRLSARQSVVLTLLLLVPQIQRFALMKGLPKTEDTLKAVNGGEIVSSVRRKHHETPSI